MRMPKQGHFAKSIRQKKVNQLKVRQPRKNSNVINEDQLTDFMLVRFALTTKKRVDQHSQESMQRLLIEILNKRSQDLLDLSMVMPTLIKELNSKVPWQFFRQVSDNWMIFQKFISRELPAVPVKKQVRVVNNISREILDEIIITNLAKKVIGITLLNSPVNNGMKKMMENQMKEAIWYEGKIDWGKVRSLFSPLPFILDNSLDQPTKDWLTELAKS